MERINKLQYKGEGKEGKEVELSVNNPEGRKNK